MKRLTLVALAVVAATTLVSGRVHAEIQKNVPEAWPGKIMIGVDPLGVQVNFTNAYNTLEAAGYGSYKLQLNVAGLIASTPKVSIWLGGGFNVGGRYDLALLEPELFVRITLERLLRIPLVPMVQGGVSGPIYIPYGYSGSIVSGAFQVKVGGGAYYFLTRNIGVGAEMHFAFGPGFIKVFDHVDTGFSGYWDFVAGARFAL